MSKPTPKLTSVLLAALAAVFSSGQAPKPPGRLVAVFVVDGLRPDSITVADTPTIARLRNEGAEYVNSHAVFPTSTRVNAAALATGTYPVLNGIVGNSMFVAGVNASAPFDTGDYRQLLKLQEVSGRAATAETLGEILQRNGRKLVTLSSGTTGNGFLLNQSAQQGVGVAIHGLFDRGTIAAYPKAVSDAIIQRFGPPPPDPDDLGQMNWTDTVLREYVLTELRPDVVIDWMGPLDSAQHRSGVGSPEAKDALRQIDASMSRTIEKIDALGLLDRTDIIITSDHGFTHHAEGVNVYAALIAAGLKKDRESTDVIVASQSQSILFYVDGHEQGKVQTLVRFLQHQPWVDVIFTAGGKDGQGGVPGTFSLDLINATHPTRAADVAVSLSWTSEPNSFSVPGTQTITSTVTGPLRGSASGHGGLSPWVVRNTLVAWGADFKKRTQIEVPASSADIAPTALAVLGLDAGAAGTGRGRVLRELLKDGPPPASLKTTRRVLMTSAGEYQASVEISTVAGYDYIDSGSRRQQVR